ncbi:MAG: helix-turn-helix domain-containing protein [Pyrinomonadaceae bacterium]
MSLTLGEKLRQAREERGISISDVAEQTRISPHYLECIENDDYKPLPGGIFNKGFLKSFAKHVGLEPNEVLQDYAQLSSTQEINDINEVRTYRPEVLTDDRTLSSMVPTVIFAGIILALMTGGILFAVNYIQNRGAQPQATLSPSPESTNTNSVVAATPETSPVVLPANDKISVELKAVSEPVWTTYTIDGTPTIQTLEPDQTLKLEANDSFAVKYSRSKVNNLQITLNGKAVTPPTPIKGNILIEIDKSNLAQIVESGQVSPIGALISPEQPNDGSSQSNLATQQQSENRPASDRPESQINTSEAITNSTESAAPSTSVSPAFTRPTPVSKTVPPVVKQEPPQMTRSAPKPAPPAAKPSQTPIVVGQPRPR